MSPEEVARRLLSDDITPDRVKKFYHLCNRVKVLPEMVLELLAEEDRKKVTGE